jgi:uncharacterized protein YyaL (SSP411 family)
MVDWLPWTPETFDRAAREAKPILLSITAAWCRACHEMDRTTYANPAVAAIIGDRFVAVRVDADRRPDINDRYNLGGWPTTAFLTADGRMITGGTFVSAERMTGVLARVAEAFAGLAADAATRSATEYTEATEDEPAADVPSDEALIEAIFATFDDEYGGFGVEPKFPHAAPVQLALVLYRDSGAPRWRAIAERTLDGMWDGGVRDRDAGGFYRYAATRDWQAPHVEKLLETNAALLDVYAMALAVLGRSVDRDRAAALARFITESLRDAAGGYYGSDADRVLYADANALAASALIRTASALGDEALAREALASFERVVLACYRPGGGLAHYVDAGGGVRGLARDQVAAIGALLDAHDLTDDEPYQMMAEEIGHYLVREMADGDGGGFFDRSARTDDIGLLRARRKPYTANAEAAVALSRLQRVSREFDFAPHAAGALLAAAHQAPRQGPMAAQYVLAARQLR